MPQSPQRVLEHRQWALLARRASITDPTGNAEASAATGNLYTNVDTIQLYAYVYVRRLYALIGITWMT
jgi:hypothetical protein